MRAIGVGAIRPVSVGKISQGKSWEARKAGSQCARYSCHFWSARRSRRGFDLDDPDLAALVSATRSARRPEGSGNSLMQENPSERSSRAVPRAIASAVSD